MRGMFGRRGIWVRNSKQRFTQLRSRPFCTNSKQPTTAKTAANGGGGDKVANSLSKHDAYKQLENLDFMTASKILFSDPPKKKKFGLDFHLVQLFFACMPSLAVYLVAQYARHEMRRMEEEQEKKKQAEEEAKAKEVELKADGEEAAANPELLEVKVRLEKLEETVKEIVVESKKQSGDSIRKSDADSSKQEQTGSKYPGNIHDDKHNHGSEGTTKASPEEKTSAIAPNAAASLHSQGEGQSKGSNHETKK